VIVALLASVLVPLLFPLAAAGSFVFISTGSPDGLIGMASRPASSGLLETEAADDFVLDSATALTEASFTGLVPETATVQQVKVEMYRVFPMDSVNPPAGSVPTRVNSPADVVFADRAGANGLTFAVSTLSPSFTVNNSVDIGIHPIPNQTTGGEGPVTGHEVRFDVTLTPALNLPDGHYFFVPEVGLSSGKFYWLSAGRPIVPPGTPFAPDIQAWIRNSGELGLAPDWLRVGTDIVGGGPPPTFNGTFSLAGSTCSPIAIAPAALGDGTVGAPYATTLTASGGVGPYSFTETGALPSGIALASGGLLSGKPGGGAGSFPIVVKATDSNGCTGTADLTLAIRAASGGGLGGPSPGGGGSPTPKITSLRIAPSSFAAASRGATISRRRRPVAVPIGTTTSYRDSLVAKTTFTVLKPIRGVKQGRTCRRPAKHRHGGHCTLYVAVGHVTHVDVAGRNRVHFSGRLNGRKLTVGSYRLSLTPRAGKRRGHTVSASFRVVHASH
jgi:Putative Ig domain